MNDTPMTKWQRDALKTFREQQEAYLEAIDVWRKSVGASTTVGAVPTTPPAPAWDPSEAVGANTAFMEAIFKQQQEFLVRMTQALNPGSSK